MIVKITIIADYYQSPEAVSALARMWMTDENFGTGLPVFGFSRQHVLAVCAAFVFSAEELFKQMTLVYARMSRQYTLTDDLPLPETIMGKSHPNIVAFTFPGI